MEAQEDFGNEAEKTAKRYDVRVYHFRMYVAEGKLYRKDGLSLYCSGEKGSAHSVQGHGILA